MRTMDEWLKSEERGGPFSHCLCCKLPLVEIDAPWLVNKEYAAGECVFEYAVCQPCRDELTERLSEESKESVRQFLETEIDWEERTREFMMAQEITLRFDCCIACRTPRDSMEVFCISALFDSGGELTTGALPLLICRPCLVRMTASLSEDSRRVWKDFLGTHFGGPSDGYGFPGML